MAGVHLKEDCGTLPTSYINQFRFSLFDLFELSQVTRGSPIQNVNVSVAPPYLGSVDVHRKSVRNKSVSDMFLSATI